MKKFFKKERNEKGEIVPMLVSVMVTITVLISAIDASMYFGNRNLVNAAVRDGARTAAIYGWPGNNTMQTTIEAAYGSSMKEACGYLDDPKVKSAASDRGITLPVGNNAVECSVISTLIYNTSLINVVITDVTCSTVSPVGTPKNPVGASANSSSSIKIRDITKCEASWEYSALPGAVFTIFGFGGNTHKSVGTSKTEVQLSSQDVVSR